MECLDTTKSLKINLKKNIGNVLMVVEGEEYEFEILKRIFCQILGYKYIEKKRYKTVFHDYNEFVMKGNEDSRVIVINARNSNISSINKDDKYLNNMYMAIYNNYGIDSFYCPLYQNTVNKTRPKGRITGSCNTNQVINIGGNQLKIFSFLIKP